MSNKFPTFIEFFAGSGLVSEGVKRCCTPIWANDISEKKAAIYTANHGAGHFHLAPIEEIDGREVPYGDIVWASFPCQDLSLAGKMRGLRASRSGLFWEWIRVIDEMPDRPPVLVIENVVGLLSTREGKDYQTLHRTLADRGYRVGPMLINARHWVPQSRPRLFVCAVSDDIDSCEVEDNGPNWLHAPPVLNAIKNLVDVVYWSIPKPVALSPKLEDIIDWDAPVFESAKTEALLNIVSQRHKERIDILPSSVRAVFPGYRRTRGGKQVLELRFDGIAGCLRTAEGGSSRQFLLILENGEWSSRLLTPREAARLMGAPEGYQLSSSYNDSYSAMGDAVARPVAEYLARHLLEPLTAARRVRYENQSEAPRFCLQA